MLVLAPRSQGECSAEVLTERHWGRDEGEAARIRGAHAQEVKLLEDGYLRVREGGVKDRAGVGEKRWHACTFGERGAVQRGSGAAAGFFLVRTFALAAELLWRF